MDPFLIGPTGPVMAALKEKKGDRNFLQRSTYGEVALFFERDLGLAPP